MDTKLLKQKILDLAIRGKLVPQDPNDEPASELLKRIRAEKEILIAEGKIKHSKKTGDKPHYENVPFEIPSSWEWVNLGEIYIHNTGKALNARDRVGELKDYITTSNLYWNHFELNEVKQMLFTEKEMERCLATKGDLLVCEGGDIGRAAIWSYDYDICIQNHIHRLRGIIPLCQDFYYYIFYYYKLTNRIGGKGVAIQGLSSDSIDKLQIPLPPLVEQQKIVEEIKSWFTHIDEIKANKQKLQEIVHQTKARILNLAIQGKLLPQDPFDEPASEFLKRIAPQVKPCDTSHYENIPFDIPNNWVWVKHNDIIDLVGGSQPPKNKFISTPQNGYIRLYQIRDYGTNPVPVYIPMEMAQKKTQKGDILLARYGGSLGKVFLAENGAYNVAMAKVVFKSQGLLDTVYAYNYYLASLYQNKLKTISRTAQVGFNENDFIDLYIPLPPLNEQKRISQRISTIFNILDKITGEL